MKTKIKTIKPIDSSISLIYSCPQCSQQHWISLKAAKTKGFIVVCDCDMVFKPKRVDKVKILHLRNNKQNHNNTKTPPNLPLEHNNNIPIDLLDRCVTVLTGYGFTKTEASDLVKAAYKKYNVADAVSLIKLSLSTNIGVNNEQSVDQAH